MPRIAPIAEDALAGSPYRRILGRRPDVLAAWEAVSAALRFTGLLPYELKEAVRQATAGRIGCRYCATVGERLGEPDTRTSLAVGVAQLVAEDRASVDERTFDVLREEFTEDEIVELIAFISFVCVGGQTFGNLMDVEPATESEQETYVAAMDTRRSAAQSR